MPQYLKRDVEEQKYLELASNEGLYPIKLSKKNT